MPPFKAQGASFTKTFKAQNGGSSGNTAGNEIIEESYCQKGKEAKHYRQRENCEPGFTETIQRWQDIHFNDSEQK